MAGIVSKIAKTVAGTAAAAGIYYAGKQSGKQEALGLRTSGIDYTLGVEAGPTKTACPTPPESPEAYHAALNDRANSLRNRIFEKAYSEGSIEERFDRLVGNAYLSIEQTEIPAETDREPSEDAPQETPNPVNDPETTPTQESIETIAQTEAVEAEETAPQQNDVIDLKNAKTGDLDPYHRIQKALSTSEFFTEESEGSKPPEFEMP